MMKRHYKNQTLKSLQQKILLTATCLLNGSKTGRQSGAKRKSDQSVAAIAEQIKKRKRTRKRRNRCNNRCLWASEQGHHPKPNFTALSAKNVTKKKKKKKKKRSEEEA